MGCQCCSMKSRSRAASHGSEKSQVHWRLPLEGGTGGKIFARMVQFAPVKGPRIQGFFFFKEELS